MKKTTKKTTRRVRLLKNASNATVARLAVHEAIYLSDLGVAKTREETLTREMFRSLDDRPEWARLEDEAVREVKERRVAATRIGSRTYTLVFPSETSVTSADGTAAHELDDEGLRALVEQLYELAPHLMEDIVDAQRR